MTQLWIYERKDFPLGKATYNSAVLLFNTLGSLINEHNIFVAEADRDPKKRPDEKYFLTKVASVTYCHILNQFSIRSIDEGFQDKVSWNEFYDNFKAIEKILQKK